MWKDAKWLRLPRAELEEKHILHGDLGGRFALFRCEITLHEAGSFTLAAEITANSRYRLWVNETPVLSGPCKGDRFRQYYETVELGGFLTVGKNAICVQVLYCDPDIAERQTDERASIYGVIGQQCGHRFAMEGTIFCGNKEVSCITTGTADWRVWLDASYCLVSDDNTQFLGAVIEHMDAKKSPLHWKKTNSVCLSWKQAEAVGFVSSEKEPLFPVGVLPKFRMRERDIPLLYEKEETFADAFLLPNGKPSDILTSGSVLLAPHTETEIILDAGVHKNGHPRFRFNGGRDSLVSITYFEKFGGAGSDLKRDDYRHGAVSGITDTVRLNGEEITFEPFWVRTFRFIRLKIKTGEEAVRLFAPVFRKTGYPLSVSSSIASSVPWVREVWDMCVRTLENCMLETYMDCPYYEQLQFAMDTRLEALYTYAVSGDCRLVRKALLDFHYGMLPDGLTPGKYPSVYLQVLSTFSLHYIFMLWEYWQQTGDGDILRLCRPDIDRILDYYDRHMGQDDLLQNLEYWQFVDWREKWNATGGMPAAILHGPSTIINLMYAYALRCAANLFAANGRLGTAREYEERRAVILNAVENACWDAETHMYREGPSFVQFSQHAQAWAILNGMITGEKARQVLQAAMDDPDCIQCTFPAAFEWFRALEKTGMYHEMRLFLNDWIQLLDLHCTTCPETPMNARSECHAWSALPLYEMMRTIAGIHMKENQWRSILVEPHLMDLPDAEGAAATPHGDVRFYYRRIGQDGWHYHVTLPPGTSGTFRFPDGTEQALHEGANDMLA